MIAHVENNKQLLICIAFVCFSLQTKAQSFTASEVVDSYLKACELMKRDSTGYADYKKSREILENILSYANDDIKKRILQRIPMAWYFEGMVCAMSKQYQEALNCYQNSLLGFQKVGNVANEISVLKGIASVKNHLYDWKGSAEAYKQALTLARNTNKTTVQMEVLGELKNLEDAIGDTRQSHVYSAQMDSLVERSDSAQLKFNYYLQKGKETKEQGQLAIAEQWYLKGYTLLDNPSFALEKSAKFLSYFGLSNLYLSMGAYDKSLVYAIKSNVESQKITPSTDSQYYMGYRLLADIYRLKGDKTKCFACLDTLFLGMPKMIEPKEKYSLYVTRGRCHFTFKDYQSALADFQKADDVLALKYPDADINRVSLLAFMGGIEHHLGDYEKSERYYRRYAEGIRKTYGEQSLDYVDALVYLANAEGFAEHIDAGCQDYTKAVDILKNLMKQRLPYMSQSEREGFWNTISSLFLQMTPYALKANLQQVDFTKSCYDALVMTKSFLLESERSLFDMIQCKGTSSDMSDYMRLTAMRNQVKALENDYKANADSILRLSRNAESLENQLINRYNNGSSNFLDVDYQTVKQSLEQNEALIDFTDFVSETNGRRYAAYIINKVQQYPLLKSLFAEKQMDSLGIVRPDMFYEEDYAQDVLKLLWEPLKEHFSEGSTVYYVPSQLLFQISLESLPLPDGSLLGSHYHFVRLSSARELVKMKENKVCNRVHTAVLYGGLQYDMEPTAMIEEAKKYDLSNLLAVRGDVVRGDSIFRELRGSKEEVIKVESVLKKQKWNVASYVGKNGTEESFLDMNSKSPMVLHLATHGFYYTPNKAGDINYLKGYTDAMSLSGLVLSGGNAAWLGKKLPIGVLGGILTANDIARLDLGNTDMVVLSACKSGQGKATSEGLYGLQRAFKKAGVGTIVMSLWGVSDKVTSEFMVAFYEQLVNGKVWNKRKAFENAKMIVRKKHPEPFYWAVFVMLD